MRLSEFELEVMAHFWRDGELSAPALFERIGAEKGVAYSTVKTIVDRLEKKGAIERAEGQADRRALREEGRERARRNTRARHLVCARRQAGADPEAARARVS